MNIQDIVRALGDFQGGHSSETNELTLKLAETSQELQKAVVVIDKAFENDSFSNWISEGFQNHHDKRECIHYLNSITQSNCFRNGFVLIAKEGNESVEGVLHVQFGNEVSSGNKLLSFLRSAWMMITGSLLDWGFPWFLTRDAEGRSMFISRLQMMEVEHEKKRFETPYLYLIQIGVLPEKQSKGTLVKRQDQLLSKEY